MSKLLMTFGQETETGMSIRFVFQKDGSEPHEATDDMTIHLDRDRTSKEDVGRLLVAAGEALIGNNHPNT